MKLIDQKDRKSRKRPTIPYPTILSRKTVRNVVGSLRLGINGRNTWRFAYVRKSEAQILKKIEPVIENPTQPAKAAKKAKSQKGQAKLQAELIPEPDEPLQCPMCEATFATDKQGDYDAHFKTHDLGGVQQAVRQ